LTCVRFVQTYKLIRFINISINKLSLKCVGIEYITVPILVQRWEKNVGA